jgi:hypothetical protein
MTDLSGESRCESIWEELAEELSKWQIRADDPLHSEDPDRRA